MRREAIHCKGCYEVTDEPAMSVSVHVRPGTEVSYKTYPDEHRATVKLGHSTYAVLSLDASELDELINVLEEARSDLIAAEASAAERAA